MRFQFEIKIFQFVCFSVCFGGVDLDINPKEIPIPASDKLEGRSFFVENCSACGESHFAATTKDEKGEFFLCRNLRLGITQTCVDCGETECTCVPF